jgi:hypothetical protein
VQDVTSKRSYQPEAAYNPSKRAKKEAKPKSAVQKKVATEFVAYNSVPVATAAANDSSDFMLFGDDNYDTMAHQDESDGEEEEVVDEGFDFDLIPNGDAQQDEE